MTTTYLRQIGRLVTASAEGVLSDAAILITGDRIAWVGEDRPDPPTGLLSPDTEVDVVDVGGGLVTPGLIDAHTHPVYAGNRFAELARRSEGATYEELAAAGGGIGSTVTATRSAPAAALEDAVADRLSQWLRSGTTTVETKTGYHLTRQGELDSVRLLARLAGRAGRTGGPDASVGQLWCGSPARSRISHRRLPRLAVTFLAAHAVPPEFEGRPDDYAAEAASWSVDAARAGADACDVFCDRGYFTVDQARTVLAAGRAAGLRLRVHADELAHTGGALLGAQLGAASCDHLLCATEEDARALAASGVTATLCPGTALSLGHTPPARLLAERGVTLALGTDHNPGTCGMTSMSLVVALAVHGLGLSVSAALGAATAGGAASLGLADRGQVQVGMLADLVLWDADHEGAFAWGYGLTAARVWKGGVEVDG
jgi:imidazolonepropionase